MDEKEISHDEIKIAIDSLKPNSSAGFDELNPKIIKLIYPAIKEPIKFLLNISFITGCFPNKLKIAKVTPVFKSGDKETLSNYRPISVLPCFSKFFERVIYNRLYSFVINNNILFEKQFGFQKNHSTEHAILYLTDQIMKKTF